MGGRGYGINKRTDHENRKTTNRRILESQRKRQNKKERKQGIDELHSV